eukprot:CAMPEP_0202081416 /NCGR_PEP_ID=MMETSP0964-20121228/13999_1 /ASSEMBLY_ACC=CAM_ASM_000500 /TAXON_ID=4773 /ORGANISM="Schizochytrium aggregatum, Strain ATCC28209" /LENGTH=264 /DNA_ID=CAMNT_0048648973 /DNA_START=41 /DNA_END=835 /DNA_ORIENTATION=-
MARRERAGSMDSAASGDAPSSAATRLRQFSAGRLRRESALDADAARAAAGDAADENAQRQSFAVPASDRLKSAHARVITKNRQVALNEPEVHILGEVEAGAGFGSGACCRWFVDVDSMWQHLGGHLEGQTQIDYPVDQDTCVWSHPLDVHLLCKGLQGWPRLLLQVWRMDEFGRLQLSGYGFTHIPNAPGSYELDIATWRPVGTLKEEIAAQFLGSTPQLRDIDLLFRKAWSDRCRLSTTSSGSVRVNIDLVMRNFQDHQVDLP